MMSTAAAFTKAWVMAGAGPKSSHSTKVRASDRLSPDCVEDAAEPLFGLPGDR
jgi:hypothetical protein